jgi:ATP-dependent DNA ligase
VKSALIAGELYYRRADGRPRVFDVSRAARQPEAQEDVERLGLAVFDLIEVDGQPAGARHADVFARIQRLFSGGERVHPVDAATVKTPEEIEKFYGSWVEEQGAEGLVLRSDSAGGFKLKPRHTLDAVVVGFTESDEDRKGMVHDLLLAVMRKDGSLHLIGRVGTGLSDDERRAMLSDLKDLATESDYAEIGEGHIAYQMVRPELVIEISCLDLISQTTRGGTIDKMVIDWDAAAKRYRPLRRMPMVSLISPVFVRRREDKRVNPTDVRAQQIGELVEVPRLEVDARAVTLPKSEVLRREVYVKTQKGQTLVRKFLMWKTNKEDSGEFPAYVLHFTDYSPTRKTPLEREIRVSSSREQIEALFTELHKENVVKGWAKA